MKEIWINLPVRDVERSKKFFTGIGFTLNENYQKEGESACFLIGEKKIAVLLFAEHIFQGFTKNELSDTKAGTEVLFSLGAGSRLEVDETATKVFSAGGTIFSEPAEIQGWMYGFAFADLDGHRWNLLYMDPEMIISKK